jgi:hypothetical protein
MHTFFVPMRTSKAGTLALQTGRLSSGERIGLAFTSEASLLLTLGPSQQWVRLDGQALKDMLAPLGVEHVRVDPRPIGELEAGGLPRERQPGPVRVRSASYRDPRSRRHRPQSQCLTGLEVVVPPSLEVVAPRRDHAGSSPAGVG